MGRDQVETYVDVSRETYEDFIRWAGSLLVRDVAQMFEPPIESFNDFSGTDIWPQSIAAKCLLVDEYHGSADPRPEDKRSTTWWRSETKIRQDWMEKWKK